MKTIELTDDACKLIADGLTLQIGKWEDHNTIIAMYGIDDVVQKCIDRNNIKIGELQTLLNYIIS